MASHLHTFQRSWEFVGLMLIGSAVVSSGAMCIPPLVLVTSDDPEIAALLAPGPTQPVGVYDFFGALKTADEARQMVTDAGLDPDNADHFKRIGLVHITDELIEEGRRLFFEQRLGDPFSIGNILSVGSAFGLRLDEFFGASFDPAQDPDGALSFLRDVGTTLLFRPKEATTNVRITLSRDLIVGSSVLPAGSIVNTGLDVATGAFFPVGLEAGQLSCAVCHASVDPLTGQRVAGRPNTDINIALFIAISPNSASTFIKLNSSDFDPFDPKFPRTGRRIIDSLGNSVQLPDPISFERAIDDYLLTVPPGHFDAGPDSVSALTRIPDSFTFGEGGSGWDGGFQIGSFGGVAAFSSAVHSFELSLLTPAHLNPTLIGIDREVFLGVVLQNAADPALRVPNDVVPSEWLAQNFPGAEREVLVEIPTFPEPSLFSLNGLVFSPPDEPFMHAVNAMSAFQNSLTVPPNRSTDNFLAMVTGAVGRGAAVFRSAGCGDCHAPPAFTNGTIIASDTLKTNAARGSSRNNLAGILVEPVLPSFDQMVPLPPNPNLLAVPAAPNSNGNLELPAGLAGGTGGYKVTALRGVYFNAPYLHDASVAVRSDAILIWPDGTPLVIDPTGIGIPGTRKVGAPVSAAHSLRALLDHDLRAILVANNQADPDLARSNVEGTGHEFFVDPGAGFSYQQQSDLIAFLLSLDDHPGAF